MKVSFNAAIGFGGLVIGLVGIGYALGQHKKLNDICERLDKKIDDISENTDIDIPEEIVERAIEKAADREAHRAVNVAITDVIRTVKSDMNKEVSAAVNAHYSNIEKEVSDTVSKRVEKINMQELSRAISEKAEAKIIEKFDGSLDDMLDKFNHNLENVQKIYGSMADALRKSGEREMVLKL